MTAMIQLGLTPARLYTHFPSIWKLPTAKRILSTL